jgi:hypothetical protein
MAASSRDQYWSIRGKIQPERAHARIPRGCHVWVNGNHPHLDEKGAVEKDCPLQCE